jgi:membrane protease YdiL (CAAX protease family)
MPSPPRPIGRSQQLVEVAVFLLLLAPSLIFSAASGIPDDANFSVVAGSTIIQDIAFLALALYFVWRDGRGLTPIGWTAKHPGKEVLLGVLLFVPFYFGVIAMEHVLQTLGLSAPSEPPAYLIPSTPAEYPLALVFLVVVAIAEETVFRGYLILRLGAISGRGGAVVLSSLIFALGHGYQGTLGIAAIAVIGAAFALVYLWRGSLVAPMVMHFLQDFVGVMLIPLLSPH